MFNAKRTVQPLVADMLKKADIQAIAIDIPLPGFPIFGVNNSVAGSMTGEYLATFAKETMEKRFRTEIL